jgi:integrase
VALEKVPGGWRLRLRYGRVGGRELRSRFRLPEMTRAQAEDRATRLERMAGKLASAGKHEDSKLAIERAAAQITEKDFASVERAIYELAADARKESSGAQKKVYTFRDVAELWLSGELHRQYPDDVRFKGPESVSIARGLFATIYPAIGEIRVEDVTLEDAERAKRLIPEDLEQGSRRSYALLIRRVMDLAEYPLRLIERSPIPRKFVPASGAPRRAFTFLYPDEDAKLMACPAEKASIGERIAYGFGTRNGCRPGEVARLTWADFELDRGIVHLDKNKTKTPRSWALSPDVIRALVAYRSLTKGRDEDRAFPELVTKHLPRRMRMQLRACGLTRANLYRKTDVRRPLRAHDLMRSTFITVALANGRGEDWVMRHTGHTTTKEVSRYRRQVDAMRLQLPWFDDLDVLLGLGQDAGQTSRNAHETPGKVARGSIRHEFASGPSDLSDPSQDATREKSTGPTSEAGPAEFQGVGQSGTRQAAGQPETKGAEASEAVVGASLGRPNPAGHAASAPADPIAQAIADLAKAARLATEAGEWGLAGRLVQQLEALRAERAGVTSLDAHRSKKNGGDR